LSSPETDPAEEEAAGATGAALLHESLERLADAVESALDTGRLAAILEESDHR
jgi:hypothetical protein